MRSLFTQAASPPHPLFSGPVPKVRGRKPSLGKSWAPIALVFKKVPTGIYRWICSIKAERIGSTGGVGNIVLTRLPWPSAALQPHRQAEGGDPPHSNTSPHGRGIGFHWPCTLSESLLCWPLLGFMLQKVFLPCLSIKALDRIAPPFSMCSLLNKGKEMGEGLEKHKK